MPVIQCIVAQWRHISSESAVSYSCYMCCPIDSSTVHELHGIFYLWYYLWQEICAINAQSGYSNKRVVLVIISMQSLVSIKQQSPRRPCDIMAFWCDLLLWPSGKAFWYAPSPPADGYCCGWYASYWNAILFVSTSGQRTRLYLFLDLGLFNFFTWINYY